MKLAHLLLVGTSALACAGLPSIASAQTAPAKATAAPDSDDNMQEIVVTGEKANRFGTDTVQSGSFRNAKILDVPMTVSVIPSAMLQSQQAIDLIDAVRNTAGVSSSGVGPGSYNNLTIRGITVDTRSSYKMDGKLNILSSTAFPLEDKDRVEVLKGASAIYYGFSPPSGIVNFVMKRPTPQFYAQVRGYGDSFGTKGGQVDVGNTMGIFGFRINALAAHQDTGIALATGSRKMVSGTFDLKPTSKLTISTDLEYFNRNVVDAATFIIPNGVAVIPSLSYLDPANNIGGLSWTNNKTDEINTLVKATYKFNRDWDFTAHYGRSYLTRLRYNPGFLPGRGATASATPTTAQYLAALDPTNAAFGNGVIRYGTKIQNAEYENIDYSAELHGKITTGAISNSILVGASRSLRSLAGSPATPRTTVFSNFINPVALANPVATVDVLPVASHIDDRGVYGFDDLAYKDLIHLTGGVRVSKYSNDGSTNASAKTPYQTSPTAWSGGAVVKPAIWASVYGTYIQGLEENAIASNNVDNALTSFAPIHSTLYEGGVKLEPRKNLLVQLAYFDIKRQGAYNERNIPGTTTLHGYGDATQTYRGFEGSVGGYVTRDLAINATVTFLKARTFQADNPASLHTQPSGTPKQTWSISGEYALSWFTPGLKVSAGAYHTSALPVDDTNNVFTPAFTTFDIGASYDIAVGAHHVIARVNGQNITGKRYWAAVGAGTLAESLPGGIVKFSLAFTY